MKVYFTLLLGALAAVLGWVSAGWFAPLPWCILAVTYATVTGGRSAGTLAAIVGGILLGAPVGTSGAWVLALTAAVYPVDRLHRETLTHRTPAAPVLLASVATLTTYPVYWGTTALLSALREPVVRTTVPSALTAVLAALIASILLVTLGRSLRTLLREAYRRVR